jgi:hypothetical protein
MHFLLNSATACSLSLMLAEVASFASALTDTFFYIEYDWLLMNWWCWTITIGSVSCHDGIPEIIKVMKL